MYHILRLTLLAGLMLSLASCTNATNPTSFSGKSTDTEQPAPAVIVETGAPLYTVAEYAPAPTDENVVRPDPVIIPLAQTSVTRRLDVQSQTDGFIYFIGTELKDGDVVAAATDVWTHPRTNKKYRRLREGDSVVSGQVMVLLDDRQAYAEFTSLDAAFEASRKDIVAGEQMVKFSKNLLKIQDELAAKQATTKVDMLNAQATVIRYEAELASKESLMTKAKGEREKSDVRMQMHEIRTSINGRVDKILKRPGEAVKAAETILQLQNFDKLRVEGYLPLEHASKVQVGMAAFIEPTRLQAPTVSLPAHRVAITDIAVSLNEAEPLILTASEDGSVLVANTQKLKSTLSHPVPVRTVACTTPASPERLVITGGDDGKVRVWDLNNLGDNPKPVRTFEETHSGSIIASAFSPDGAYCATADDRAIFLWDVKAGKKLYQLSSTGHKAPITELNFTPQCKLISAAKDNTLCVWTLGVKGANVERRIEHRSGEVPQLGVSSDGNWALFDQDKSQLQVVNLRDARTETVIDNVIEQAKFTTLARFSPDQKQVLSASAADGILQLWRLPAANEAPRASELRRFTCPNGSMPTCAEFVPTATGGFIVVGTQNGYLHVWPLPSKAELDTRMAARVTFIDNAVDTGGRMLRVWAEFDNTGDLSLRPGTSATLILQPQGRVAQH